MQPFVISLIIFTVLALIFAIVIFSTMPQVHYKINNNNKINNRTKRELEDSSNRYCALLGPTSPFYLCRLENIITTEAKKKQMEFIFEPEIFIDKEDDRPVILSILSNKDLEVYKYLASDDQPIKQHFRFYDTNYAYIERPHGKFEERRSSIQFIGMKEIVNDLEEKFESIKTLSEKIIIPKESFTITVRKAN